MNTTRLKQARQLFHNPAAPVHTVRHNQRAWVRALRSLGNKWLLTTPVPRKDHA